MDYRKMTDEKLLELYQDQNDSAAGQEIAKRIKAKIWTLGA